MPEEFTFTGNVQEYEVDEAGIYLIKCWGGGNNFNPQDSHGGYVEGKILLDEGDELKIYVGGGGKASTGGWNGGGNSNFGSRHAGGGAGASDVRLNGTALSDRIIVAGGAGGQGRDGAGVPSTSASAGGQGGADVGERGNNGTSAGSGGGYGGTQSAGGSGANNGSLGQGGNGQEMQNGNGGGGGGGYYGGGGGYGSTASNGRGAGGGGGSNFIHEDFYDTTSTRGVDAEEDYDGKIIIEFLESVQTFPIISQPKTFYTADLKRKIEEDDDWNDYTEMVDLKVENNKLMVDDGETEGYRISNPLPLSDLEFFDNSLILWDGDDLEGVKIYTMIKEDVETPTREDENWEEATNNQSIPEVTDGESAEGKYYFTKIEMDREGFE